MLALIHSFEARLSPLYLSEMLARCIPAQTEDVLSALIQEKTRARLAAAKTQKRRTAIAKGKRVVADGRKALAGYLPQRIRFSFATETEAKAHEKTQIIGDELEIVLLAKHGMVEFDMRNKMPWEWLVRFQTRAFVAVEGFKTRMRGLGLNPGEVCFDFEGVKMVPEVQRPELSSVVDKLLVAVYDAMRLIPKLERKNLANSLSYNMNPKGSRVERVKLFSLVQRFLRSHPIFISFRGTESPESSSIDSLLSITDSRMSLVCCFEPTAPGQLVAPQNYASLISERLAKEICLLEVKALRDTMQEERKTSAAALHRDEKDPLGLGYADAISLLNVVLRLLFHDSSNRNLYQSARSNTLHGRVKIDIDEKGATESKPLLRMLVAVPALLEHIANALRIAEGLSACPKIGEVAVTLKCGRPQDDFWELSLKEAELSICVQPSATDCIIPTQDAVLSRLILMSCGPAKEPLRCFPVNVGTKEPELLSPLLSDSPLLVAFHVEGCTGELPDEVLACAVSLSSPTEPSVSIVLEKAEKGELRVRLDHLSKTNDLTKLAIRVGNSLAFTEVFIPPKMVLDVYKLLEFSQKTRPMSKEDEKTQKMLFPRSAHMRTFNASYFVPLHSAAGIRHDSPVFKGLKARDVLAAFGCRVKEVSFKNAPIIKWHSAVKVAEGLLCVSLEVIVGENIAQCVAGKDGKLLPIIPEGDAAKLAKAVGKEEGDVRGLKAYYVVCVGDDNAVLGTQPIPESRKS